MSKAAITLGLLALAAAGCGGEGGWDHPFPPLEELPWPTPQPRPPCTPFAPGFALPTLAAPTGRLRVENPVALHAAGVIATLDLVALDGTGEVDPLAAGDVTLDLGAGATVLGSSAGATGHAPSCRAVTTRPTPGS